MDGQPLFRHRYVGIAITSTSTARFLPFLNVFCAFLHVLYVSSPIAGSGGAQVKMIFGAFYELIMLCDFAHVLVHFTSDIFTMTI